MKKKILFMMAFTICFQFVNSQAIDSSKILMHFPFDSDLADDSTVGVALSAKTANTVSTFRDGKIGNSALFDSKPYITVGSTFDAGATHTIATWVKFNALTANSKIIHQEEDPDANTLNGRPLQLVSNGKINSSFGEVQTNSTLLPVADDWVHVALVTDVTAETVTMYINGEQEASATLGNLIKDNGRTNNAEISFGVNKASSVAGLLNGYLDDFMISSEALTANQIKAVMNLGVAEAQTANTNIWLGTTADFGTGSNWSEGTVPVLAENVLIPSGTANNPTASAAVSAKNIVIQKNASLNVGVNNITATSTTVYGGGSLIAKGTVSGSFTYNVITTIDNTALPVVSDSSNPAVWSLLSSPVVGETYDNDYILDHFIGTGAVANRAIALYNNNSATNGGWSYYQSNSGTTPTFERGIGFSTRKKTFDYQDNNEEVYGFTGAFPESDVELSISQGSESNWNLIGNPFPSYIRVSELLSTVNGGGSNTDNLSAAHQTVYIWNPATGAYASLASGDYIQPGQGFFVNADNSTAGNFSIPESLQSHQTGVTFYKNADSKISLSITDGEQSRVTYISYASNNKLSLDPGNDIGMFTGVSSNLNVFTALLEGYDNVAFERQALPDADFENMIIPIGVIASEGEKITFSSEAQNLPTGIDVYLEDRVENTYTKINGTDNNHTITLNASLNSVGRFYLHTSASSVLSVNDAFLSSVLIFKTNNDLRINGLQDGKASLELYNILGKRVLQNTFTTGGNKTITLPNLATGMYIAKLATEQETISKKIILE